MATDIRIQWLKAAEIAGMATRPVVVMERPQVVDPDEAALRQAASTLRESARQGTVWVPKGSLLQDADGQKWSVIRSGKEVIVPVFAYDATHAARSSILALGMGLGLNAGLSLQRLYGCEPDVVHLYLGDDLLPVGGTLRAFVGLAAIQF